MKKLLLLLCICAMVSSAAFSQVTYLADTGFITDVGFGGAPASCTFTGGSSTGWKMNRAQDSWVADVFTVPADTSWTFDTVIVYGYQVGSSTTSTFLSCNLEVYNGTPDLGGSIIWGDTVTNVLVATDWTGIYRVDTDVSTGGGLTNTARPIMYLKLHLSPALHLTSGTYWLSWSAAGSLSATTSSPEKVLPGRINPPSQQARQLYSGVWDYITDDGYDIGMDMIIKASAAAVATSVPTINMPSLSLDQNVPNPFNGSTTLSFYMPQAGYAKLAAYNTIGQVVATLNDGDLNAGKHSVTFNADGLAAGVYYYRLSTDAGVESKEMLLIK